MLAPRRCAVFALLLSVSSLAAEPPDEREWQTPTFAPPPAAAKVELPPLPVKERPDPTRWQYPHLVLALTGLFGQSTYLAVRASVGMQFGRPTRNLAWREGASGALWAVGLEGMGGKTSIALCGGTSLCGTRFGGGVFLRGGWTVGHIDVDGVVRPVHSLFAQLVPYLAAGNIPSQPLAPGAAWTEAGFRIDVGGMTAFKWPQPGAKYVPGGLYVVVQLEYLAVRRVDTGAFRGGLSLGLAL